MDDDQAGVIAPAVSSSKKSEPKLPNKRRGRPPGNSVPKKRETAQQRIDRLKLELQEAQEAVRKVEAQRKAIVGDIVLAKALIDDGYGKQLAAVLRENVKDKKDRAAIADLIGLDIHQ